jgi:hypothetical protein
MKIKYKKFIVKYVNYLSSVNYSMDMSLEMHSNDNDGDICANSLCS